MQNKVLKCPACGALRESMSTQCVECGYEFRDSTAALISELNEKFDSLRDRGLSMRKYERLSIDIIKNFKIPQVREELLDVLIYIQPKALDKKDSPVREAWYIRQREVIERAKLAFDSNPETMALIDRYDKELKKFEKQVIKRGWRKLPFLVKLLIILFGLFILLLILPARDVSKEAFAVRFNEAVENQQVDKALKYLKECPEMGQLISTDYTTLIAMLLEQDRIIEANALYEQMSYFTSSTTDKFAIRETNKKFLSYYLQKGNLDHAIKFATDVESLSQLMRIFLDNGDTETALEIFKKNTMKFVKYDTAQHKRVVLTDDEVVAEFIKANTYGF